VKTFFSHGKLLLTGEYLVLDGAKALALPTRYGQEMEVTEGLGPGKYLWSAWDHDAQPIDVVPIDFNQPLPEGDTPFRKRLYKTMSALRLVRTEIASESATIKTELQFHPEWGLGSSSTFIANLCKWQEVDPFPIYEAVFGGSGYDVAVAMEGHSLTYERSGRDKRIRQVRFEPTFKRQLYFVYLNQKQDSRAAIESYRAYRKSNCLTEEISALTDAVIECNDVEEFQLLIRTHEKILADILQQPRVKERLFPDYPFEVKSLGGWGGDFILAVGDDQTPNYFAKNGFTTCIPFDQMIHPS
jgi:mevalonate kinase